MARLAEWLGKEGDRAHFDKRVLSYATIFDPESGWFRPRNEKGVFSSLPEKGRFARGLWLRGIQSLPARMVRATRCRGDDPPDGRP